MKVILEYVIRPQSSMSWDGQFYPIVIPNKGKIVEVRWENQSRKYQKARLIRKKDGTVSFGNKSKNLKAAMLIKRQHGRREVVGDNMLFLY